MIHMDTVRICAVCVVHGHHLSWSRDFPDLLWQDHMTTPTRSMARMAHSPPNPPPSAAVVVSSVAFAHVQSVVGSGMEGVVGAHVVVIGHVHDHSGR